MMAGDVPPEADDGWFDGESTDDPGPAGATGTYGGEDMDALTGTRPPPLPLGELFGTILEAKAHPISADDPRYPVPESHPTPAEIEAAAVTRANLAADEAEATRPLTDAERVDHLAIVEAQRVRLGLPTLTETLDVLYPVPPRRTNGADLPALVTSTVVTTAEPPGHLVRQSRAAWYFAQMAGDRVRFDHGRGRWLVWAGHRWRPDEDGSVSRLWLAMLAARYRRALAADDRERARLTTDVQTAGATNAAITAGLEIASSMEPIATTADAWDPDPWVLGCKNGVVELRTGALRPGRPEEMISRSTGIAYDPDAGCPRWMRFLAEVFAGDAELVDWYALLVGTSLVGVPQELLAINHGSGNNGKSVAVKVLRHAFGEYATTIPVETLTNAKRAAGEATPDLMKLRGARLAFTSEPDQAAKLRAGTLKRLASVDQMTGRSLYGTTQTWDPTHTVHLSTNHLPAVDDATDGFWRRVALVGWPVHFRKPGEDGDAPPEDSDLAAALTLEAPGILAWAIRGAVAHAAGWMLWPFPASVRARTAAYRADEDKLGAFVAERVVYERVGAVTVGDLFAAYREWCEATAVPPFERLSRKALSRQFEERGHGVGRGVDTTKRVILTGARLAVSTNPEDPEYPTPLAGSPYVNSDSRKFRQVPPNTPDTPETVLWPTSPDVSGDPADRPPCTRDPDSFRAHASSRRLVGGREVCDACRPGPAT
jgi:putative DNA primase/helicase